jgi:DivIVA domain-containing protein
MATPTVLLILVVVLVLAALVFGVVSLLGGDDPGLGTAEPDGRAVGLPNNRSLSETDLKSVRFDLSWRGYRMAQVDRVLRRTAYDIGYKDEMIAVLEAEVQALRDGREEDADLLRKARESAANPANTPDPVITLDPETSWSLPRNEDESSVDSTSISRRRRRSGVMSRTGRPTTPASGPADVEADLVGSAAAGSERGRGAGRAEAAPLDAGPLDAGPVDAGPLDAGPLDAGPVDAALLDDAGEAQLAEAVRLEEARQEAATPGRLAERSPAATAPEESEDPQTPPADRPARA